MSNQDFESIFDGKEAAASAEVTPPPEAAPQPTEPAATEPKGETQEPAAAEPGEGEPPAPGNDKQVPLSALEAERKQRQDWKEKAIRADEQIKALEREREEWRQRHATQPQQQPAQPRELTEAEKAMDERFNTSELLARERHPDLDEKFAAWQAAAQKNPAMVAEMQHQRHPWEHVYQVGQRLLAMQDIGDDPAAYRERVRQELLAEMQAQQQPATQPAPSPNAPAAAVPQSLATARSAASRSAPAFTGPRPFDELFQ